MPSTRVWEASPTRWATRTAAANRREPPRLEGLPDSVPGRCLSADRRARHARPHAHLGQSYDPSRRPSCELGAREEPLPDLGKHALQIVPGQLEVPNHLTELVPLAAMSSCTSVVAHYDGMYLDACKQVLGARRRHASHLSRRVPRWHARGGPVSCTLTDWSGRGVNTVHNSPGASRMRTIAAAKHRSSGDVYRVQAFAFPRTNSMHVHPHQARPSASAVRLDGSLSSKTKVEPVMTS